MEFKTKQFSRLIFMLTPIIILISFGHILLPTHEAGMYINGLTIVGLSAICALVIIARKNNKDEAFRSIANSFFIFAGLLLLAEILWVIMSYTGLVLSLFYLSLILGLVCYMPLIYTCWKTLFSYAEYANVRLLILITLFMFSISLALLIPIGNAVGNSLVLPSMYLKFIAIAYPYLDMVLLLVLFLLLHVYRKGKLAFYWAYLTVGILLFTVGDLINAVITAYDISTLENIPGSMFVMAYFYLAIGFSTVVYFTKRRKIMEPERLYDVRQVFMIYESGLLISHVGKDKGVIDKTILSGMLSAVQIFIKDSFRTESDKTETLKRLQYGELEIHIEHGKYIFLAVVLEGKGTERLHVRMQDAITNIETNYKDELRDWDGDLDLFSNMPEHLRELFL